MSELSALIARHCRDNVTLTAIPRLILSRSAAPTDLTGVMYYPLLCVLAQGRKRVFLGAEEFRYDPNSYLIASLDLPVSGQVLEAPALGLTLSLEPAMVAELLLSLPSPIPEQPPAMGLGVHPLEGDLLDPLLRLLRLLDRPADIPMLAPLIEREILYRLLCGPRGDALRQLSQPGSRLSQIGRAIAVIRQRFSECLPIEELARAAGMSATSFHRHFRSVTAMSPLQFQKQIRLQAARNLLLNHKMDAARAGFEVGYESASQFSREYRRHFGLPPAQDVARQRLAQAAYAPLPTAEAVH